MVATLGPFDGSLATRATFDVVIRSPLLEKLGVLRVRVGTELAFVIFDVAIGTYPNKACRTLQDGFWKCCSIYLRTVRSRTIVELSGPRVYVGQKGRVCKPVEIFCAQ